MLTDLQILDVDGSTLAARINAAWVDASGRAFDTTDAIIWGRFALGELSAAQVWDGATVKAEDSESLLAEINEGKAKLKRANALYWARKRNGF